MNQTVCNTQRSIYEKSSRFRLECQELEYPILNAPAVLRLRSPVSHGRVWGISELAISLLYPYVLVAGSNKHDCFRPI